MEALTRTGSTIEHRCPTTVQHKHELEEKQLDIVEKHDEKTWRSCCLTADKHACVFGIQTLIAIICLSAAMLVNFEGECDKSSPYINVIMVILGSFIRTPGIKNQ